MFTTTAQCPDCGEERLLVEVGEGEFCCTWCDAAVLFFGVVTDGRNGLSQQVG